MDVAGYRTEGDVARTRDTLPALVRWVVAAGVVLAIGVAGFGIGVAIEGQTANDVRSQLTTMHNRLYNATHVGPIRPATTVAELRAAGFFDGVRRQP